MVRENSFCTDRVIFVDTCLAHGENWNHGNKTRQEATTTTATRMPRPPPYRIERSRSRARLPYRNKRRSEVRLRPDAPKLRPTYSTAASRRSDPSMNV